MEAHTREELEELDALAQLAGVVDSLSKSLGSVEVALRDLLERKGADRYRRVVDPDTPVLTLVLGDA
jgi:hypothetical protein